MIFRRVDIFHSQTFFSLGLKVAICPEVGYRLWKIGIYCPDWISWGYIPRPLGRSKKTRSIKSIKPLRNNEHGRSSPLSGTPSICTRYSDTPLLATLAKRRLVLTGFVRSTGGFEFSGTTSNQKHRGQCPVLEEVEPSAFPIDNPLNVSVLQFQCKC